MEYEFKVTFRRNLSDDLPIAETNFTGADERELLMKQLRAELQASYDELGMAGSFEIDLESFRRL
jgi:hypothetical protein